jgi:hypothetical protein
VDARVPERAPLAGLIEDKGCRLLLAVALLGGLSSFMAGFAQRGKSPAEKFQRNKKAALGRLFCFQTSNEAVTQQPPY